MVRITCSLISDPLYVTRRVHLSLTEYVKETLTGFGKFKDFHDTPRCAFLCKICRYYNASREEGRGGGGLSDAGVIVAAHFNMGRSAVCTRRSSPLPTPVYTRQIKIMVRIQLDEHIIQHSVFQVGSPLGN